jgi:poly(3-hydroxybutyrate) depolymerase
LTKADIQKPGHEHSVPWFWPMAAAIEMEEAGIRAFADNMRFLAEAEKIESPPPPKWATKNRVLRNLDTMLLRDFSRPGATGTPVLVDAPYAGHSSTIADFAKGQSLAETLMTSGLSRVLVTDWKSASRKMRDYDIDRYLSDLDRAVEAIGGRVHLVGLCQGGWMAAMYACLHREKVASLVLAGSPIDTNAGDGPIKRLAHATPMRVYEEMVAAGGGRMLGQFMLAGWKDMHPGEQYLGSSSISMPISRTATTSTGPSGSSAGTRIRSTCPGRSTSRLSASCSRKTASPGVNSSPWAGRCL